jgi:S1-C subfamily serine protease
MLRNDFGLVLQDRNGAIVRAIIPGSPAADQGLRDGMRITHVNNVAVDDANAAAAALYINGLLWGRTVRVNVEQTVAGQEGAPDSTQALELVLRIGN